MGIRGGCKRKKGRTDDDNRVDWKERQNTRKRRILDESKIEIARQREKSRRGEESEVEEGKKVGGTGIVRSRGRTVRSRVALRL